MYDVDLKSVFFLLKYLWQDNARDVSEKKQSWKLNGNEVESKGIICTRDGSQSRVEAISM